MTVMQSVVGVVVVVAVSACSSDVLATRDAGAELENGGTIVVYVEPGAAGIQAAATGLQAELYTMADPNLLPVFTANDDHCDVAQFTLSGSGSPTTATTVVTD